MIDHLVNELCKIIKRMRLTKKTVHVKVPLYYGIKKISYLHVYICIYTVMYNTEINGIF